jgi:hypothetical protein
MGGRMHVGVDTHNLSPGHDDEIKLTDESEG